MADCQKEIRCRRAHTRFVLCFEGVAVRLQIHSVRCCGLTWPPRLRYQGVEPVAATSFPGAALAVKTREEDWFRIRHILSCDQAGKRFTNANTQSCRHCLKINRIPASVHMGAFGKGQRPTALLLESEVLGMPLSLRARVCLSHQSSGCRRDDSSEQGSPKVTSPEDGGEALVPSLPKMM